MSVLARRVVSRHGRARVRKSWRSMDALGDVRAIAEAICDGSGDGERLLRHVLQGLALFVRGARRRMEARGRARLSVRWDAPLQELTLREATHRFQRELILARVASCGGDVRAARDSLGVPKNTFLYRVKVLRLRDALLHVPAMNGRRSSQSGQRDDTGGIEEGE